MSKQKNEKTTKKQKNIEKLQQFKIMKDSIKNFTTRYQNIKVSFLNCLDNQAQNSGFDNCRDLFIAVIKEATLLRNELTEFENKYNLSNNKNYDNDFILLKLKICSLFLRVHLKNSSPDPANSKLIEIALKDLLLCTATNQHRLKLKDDLDFQEEMNFYLIILLDRYPTLMASAELTVGKFYNFCLNLFSKSAASYQKLQFFELYFMNIVCNDPQPNKDKEQIYQNLFQAVEDTYNKLIKDYSKLIAANAKEQYAYLQTLVTVFNFEHLKQQHFKYKHIQNEDYMFNLVTQKEYIKFKLTLVEKYITPILELCSNLDIPQLATHSEIMKLFDTLFLKIMLHQVGLCQELKDLYHALKLVADPDHDFREQLIEEIPLKYNQLITFLMVGEKYLSNFALMKNVMILTPGYREFLEELAGDTREITQSKQNKQIELIQAQQLADANALMLIQEEQSKAQYRQQAKSATIEQCTEDYADESSEEITAIDDLLTAKSDTEIITEYLQQAQHQYIHKNYYEAFKHFYLAKMKAEAIANPYLLLSAMDGCLSAFCFFIEKKLETIDKLLCERLANIVPMPTETLLNLKTLTEQAIKKLPQLDQLLNDYYQLLEEQSKKCPKEEQQQLIISRDIIGARINDIHLRVDKIREQYQELQSIKQYAIEQYQRSKQSQERPTQESNHFYKEENNLLKKLDPQFNGLLFSSLQLQQKYANTMSVIIPKNIKEKFNIVKKYSEKPCLVGSAALHLISKKLGKLDVEYADYDFLSLHIPKKTLICEGFTQTHNLQLYNHKPSNIQIFILEENVSNISASFLKRDFTVCSLGVLENGNVLGLNEQTIADIQNNFLRTVDKAQNSIKEDPVRIIRAIKMQMRNWTLDPLLIQAIRSWKPDEHFINHKAHLNDVSKKLLNSANKAVFVQHLIDYDLMNKMFDFDIQGSFSPDIILEFEKHLQTKYISNNANLFFNTYDEKTEPQNNNDALKP